MRVKLWSQCDFTSLWEKKKEKEKERKEATHTSNMSLVTQRLASAQQFGMEERMLESQEVYALISAKNVK